MKLRYLVFAQLLYLFALAAILAPFLLGVIFIQVSNTPGDVEMNFEAGTQALCGDSVTSDACQTQDSGWHATCTVGVNADCPISGLQSARGTTAGDAMQVSNASTFTNATLDFEVKVGAFGDLTADLDLFGLKNASGAGFTCHIEVDEDDTEFELYAGDNTTNGATAFTATVDVPYLIRLEYQGATDECEIFIDPILGQIGSGSLFNETVDGVDTSRTSDGWRAEVPTGSSGPEYILDGVGYCDTITLGRSRCGQSE